MVNYLANANKLVQCIQGHKFKIPISEIFTTCPVCGQKIAFSNFGTIASKFH